MSIIIYASILHTAYCLTFKKLNFQKRHHKLRHKAQTALQSETKTSRVFPQHTATQKTKADKKKKEYIEKIQKKRRHINIENQRPEKALCKSSLYAHSAHTPRARAPLFSLLSVSLIFQFIGVPIDCLHFVFVDCRSKSSKSERIVGPRAIVIFRT